MSCRNLKLWHQKQSVLAGVGYGCAYTPPIQALIEWFPDKRGLASGVVIAGFGSGALFFTPAMNSLMQKVSAIYMITYNNVNSIIIANQIIDNNYHYFFMQYWTVCRNASISGKFNPNCY